MTKKAIGLFIVTLLIGVVLLWESFFSQNIIFDDKGSIENLTLRGFGVILLLIGGLPLIGLVMKNVKKKKFKDTHILICATLDEIEVIEKYTDDNGYYPIKFYCSYVDEAGKVYKFSSDEMWDAPNYQVGDKIKVYVNPNNYKSYTMDLYNEL